MTTICENCCEAGEYNKHGNQHAKEDKKDLAQLAYDAAAEYHAQCLKPQSCLCQHRTGLMVQK